MSIYDEVILMEEQLISWRRDLHQIPEIGLDLPDTVAYVSKVLDSLQITYTVYPEISCITALIGQGSPCIMLRGDMDGLPIVEVSGEPFASVNGCMHGCGHDLHTSTMLGVAAMLKKHESELKGTVKLLFQSAEETFQGADGAIKVGVLNDPVVDAAFAMHVFADTDAGSVLYGKMPMASVYGFKITIDGCGGHGSQPERCIDPINAGVQVYLALQSLIARECPPTKEAALTIGQFTSGSASNAIPQTAVLQGTLRTFEPDVHDLLIERINSIVPAVCAAYRCQCTIEVLSDVPSVICDDEMLDLCLKSVELSQAAIDLRPGLHLTGSEDFAFIAEKLPSCYLVIGAGVDDVSRRRSQHNPEILFNEDAIARAVAIYTQVAFDYFNK